MKNVYHRIHTILIVFLLLSLPGCAVGAGGIGNTAPAEVPESKIRIAMNDRMDRTYPNRNDYYINATHHPDKDTHTDEVDAVVTVDYDYGSYVFTTSMTFEYDKSSDLWSMISGGKMENTHIEWKENDLRRRWSGVESSFWDATYSVDVIDTDLSAQQMEAEIEFDYHTMDFVNSFTPEDVVKSFPYSGILDFEEQMDGELVWRYGVSRYYSVWVTPQYGISITDWDAPDPLH